jgi:sulfoxide reductase heme-binding subunit YedZ
MKYPWYDYSRRLSPLKLTVFVALFLPALWVATAFALDWLGARPLNEAIHQIGLWMLRFMFAALAVTPLRQIWQWPRLILVRRMLGVAAFAYGLGHFTLYCVDQAFDVVKIATEIALRFYLTIGFVALLGLAALAATSTDAMVRRLGRRWQRLHRIIYGIALLAVVHYWIQSKLDVWEPTIMAGVYIWLMGYRALLKTAGVRGRLPLPWLAPLALAAPLVTAGGEAVYFWLAFGVSPMRVFNANLSLQTGIRPAVIVLGLAATVSLIGAVRSWKTMVKQRPRFA